MGLQVSPSKTFRSLRSTPMALRMAAPAAELAYRISNALVYEVNMRERWTHRLGAVTARGRGGPAVAASAGNVRGCGGRKKGEGERGEECEAGEHLGLSSKRQLSAVCWGL